MFNRIPQPDGILANSIITSAQTLMRDADTIRFDIEDKRLTVVNGYKSLQEEIIQKVLTNIPIERLNETGQGLRLGVMQNAGVKNVAQLLRMTEQQLLAIRGVGEQTARQAKVASINIARSVRENAQVRIDPDQHTPTSTQLVKALYSIRRNKDNSATCARILAANHSQVMADIECAHLTMHKFRWFISFQKTRIAAIKALNKLENFLSSTDAEELARVAVDYRLSATGSDDQPWDDYEAHSADYYSLLESITGTKTDARKAQGDLPQDLVDRVESQELNCSLLKSSLRGYQEFGAKFAIAQRHTLIGDEMGLGKTVEAIAAMAHLKAEGARYFAVVCPASVLINWCREIVKHSHFKVYKVHGSDRETQLAEWTQSGGVVVTTYGTIKSITLPAKIKLDMLVADEAHYAKNPAAQRSQALYTLTKFSHRVLFMTGTPLENRVEEMRNLISTLQPKIAAGLNTAGYLTGAQQFRHQIAPVYLRRNREDVLKELPELVEMEEWVEFGPDEELKYYEAVENRSFMDMRRAAWSGGSAANSAKLNRLLEICADAEENNRKIVIFSFFRIVISIVSQTLGQRCMEPIIGSVAPARRQQIIDDFTAAPAGTTLICQIQAGGVGLNIQAASVVILCEPQIKPALETQAISRAYRMGQTHNVVVHRLLTVNSVDERMMEILGNKQQLFDSYARESVVAESSLQAKDITEKGLIDQIVSQEQIRLGLTIRPNSAIQ